MAGRYKLDNTERKTKAFTVVLTESTYIKFMEHAKTNRQSVAAMARIVIEDAVGDGNVK